jgi:hypothetical protein
MSDRELCDVCGTFIDGVPFELIHGHHCPANTTLGRLVDAFASSLSAATGGSYGLEMRFIVHKSCIEDLFIGRSIRINGATRL